MAVDTYDGFDRYADMTATAGVGAKWTVTNAPTLGAGRFGTGQRIRLNNNNFIQAVLPTPRSTFGLGYARKGSGHVGLAELFLMDATFTTFMLQLQFLANGSITVQRGNTTMYNGVTLNTTPAGVIVAGQDHHIELSGTIHDSTGTIVLKVDGTTHLNLSGQDTRNGTPTQVGAIRLGCTDGTAVDRYIDDFYFGDQLYGDCRMDVFAPNADVAQGFGRSAGSVNYSLVDEATPNGDTDYVQGSTVGDVDTYGLADFGAIPDNIYAVKPFAWAKKTDAGSRSIALQLKSGGTTEDGANFALGTSYGLFERIKEVDPDTAAAWIQTGVDALQAGPKVTV